MKIGQDGSGKKSKQSEVDSEFERELEQLRMVKEIALMKEALEGKEEKVELQECDLIDS